MKLKRIYDNFVARLLSHIIVILPLRLISTALHTTTLDRLYKPGELRRTSHLELSPKITNDLPRYCYTIFNQKMDPINFVFVGTEAGLKYTFEKAGWHSAHPWTPLHLLAGGFAGLFKRSYKQGPFMPLFTGVGLQDFGFQKTTVSNTIAQRHHIRLWRTRHVLPGGKRVWTAAATHETGLKITAMPPFVVHKMDPDLDFERDFIAKDLQEVGALIGEYIEINPPIAKTNPAKNPNRDPYYTDGNAVVVEIL